MRLTESSLLNVIIKSISFIGLFNISDKVMISLSILMEIREFFKTGHPLTNIINAKFNTLEMRSRQVISS